MGLASIYLVLYNAILAIGWGSILQVVLSSAGKCTEDNIASDLVPDWIPFGHGQVCGWSSTADIDKAFDLLVIFQSLALLECVHAIVGLVRSAVGTTLMQVYSRLHVLWLVTYVVPAATIPTGAWWMMLFVHALTEVIRYSWYAFKEVLGEAPYVLTWCRYSLFYVLYPLGVYCENVLILTAAAAFTNPSARVVVAYRYFQYLSHALYYPGFPPLYFHMIAQRKKVIGGKGKKPAAAPKKERGVQFPMGEDGKRSTSIAGANIIAATFDAIGKTKEAEACKAKGSKWRFGYLKFYQKMVYASLESPENTVKMATAGLAHMHENFRFIDSDGVETSFKSHMEQMAKDEVCPFHVGTVQGKLEKGPTSWKVPYKGKTIEADELRRQLDEWASYGTIERDTADAVQALISEKGQKWIDLRGMKFVVIGTGSAMGPFPKLMELGATVIAIDIPGVWGARPAEMWQRLITTARNSPGKLIFPMSCPQTDCGSDEELFNACGCNLMEQPGEILNWLLKEDVCGDNKPVTVGNYTYLDSDLHVKLSLCADALIQGLINKKKKDVRVAFLCTPTDLHVIPKSAWEAMKTNASPMRLKWPLEKVIGLLPGQHQTNVLKPAGPNKDIYVVDAISMKQGPNYALAKRLQHWRACLAYDYGCIVATNIAPTTATASVVSNKIFKMAMEGMDFHKPMEIFKQETTNAVMAAMLVHDIQNPDGPANPKNRARYEINNLLELFKYGAWHGGTWRIAYNMESLGVSSILSGMVGGATVFVALFYGTVAASIAFLQSDLFLQSAFVADMKTLVLG